MSPRYTRLLRGYTKIQVLKNMVLVGYSEKLQKSEFEQGWKLGWKWLGEYCNLYAQISKTHQYYTRTEHEPRSRECSVPRHFVSIGRWKATVKCDKTTTTFVHKSWSPRVPITDHRRYAAADGEDPPPLAADVGHFRTNRVKTYDWLKSIRDVGCSFYCFPAVTIRKPARADVRRTGQ